MSAQVKAFATKYGIKNIDLIQTTAYINGKFINTSDLSTTESEDSFDVINPATNEVELKVNNTPIHLIEQGIVDTSNSFKSFKKTSGRQRAQYLRNLYDLIIENTDDLAKIITIENGKTLTDAKGEIKYGNSFFEWFAEEAPRVYGDNIPSADPTKRIFSYKIPVGVVGVLTPWNFPIAMISRKLGAAFAAGCTTIVKPATETPLTALAVAHLVDKAGFPPGTFNVVPVDSKRTIEVGKLFCESEIIKKISFTGSTGVGKLLMSQSASTLKKISFELGGNAPFVVFDDADLDKAVDGAINSKLRQSGQTCICANRLYIQEGIYDEFSKKLVEKVSKLKLGNGLEEGITHGPLIHERAVEKVQFQIKDAVSKGGEVILGGKHRTDLGEFFHDLTVVSNVTKEMDVAHNETFGPLVPLFKFKDEDDLLEQANDTEYGLAAYLFTKDNSRVFRVGENLQAGMVGVNTGLMTEAALPFGPGANWSGFGKEGSKYGIEDYLVVKSLVLQL